MFGLTPYRRGRSLARRDDLMGVRSICRKNEDGNIHGACN
jgi:hypothetical protein